MFLLIFAVSTYDMVVPVVATMSRRDRCIVDCSPDVAMNFLRPRCICDWFQEGWLLETDMSMTELSSSSDCSWLTMLETPISERIIGELLWPNRVDVPIWR